MAIPGYKIRKAAQVVAFFASNSGGAINVLKLAKLVYLADRECLARYDCPILYDRLVSMPHGPVDSLTLNYINGLAEDRDDWDQFISGRAHYCVGVAHPITSDDLDELSDAELEILRDIWNQHGSKSQYQLREYTHHHCPEWEDPHGSSTPIPYERVFKFLGKKDSEMLDEALEEERALFRVLTEEP